MSIKLEIFGWNDFFKARFAQYSNQGLLPGRVTIQHKDRYVLFTEQGEVSGKVSGKFRFEKIRKRVHHKIKNPSRVIREGLRIQSAYAYKLTIRFHTCSFEYTYTPPPTVI